jgi:hypothetical protein
MGIADRVKSEGVKLGMKAMGKLMEEPARAEKLMKAVETAQKTKDKVDETTHRLLNASNLIAADDLKDLSKHAGRLKREAKKVLAQLDALEQKLGG